MTSNRITSEPPSLTVLRATFVGELIDPDHPRYDEARKLYNGVHDKRPALIARCTRAADVQAALTYARDRDLVVAVRGGGHSTPGYSTCDGGLVIDTGPMKSVEIDAGRRTGRFGAGLTWGELDCATQEHGLACHRRTDLAHRHRGVDARERLGLARAQIRRHLREHALGTRS